MKQRRDIPDSTYIELYNQFKNLSMIASELNVPHITAWRKCKQLGLMFDVGVKHNKIPLDDILNGLHPQYQTYKLRNRLIKQGYIEYKCDICGIMEWNNTEIVLQLDHIDGIGNNHLFSNLRLLCPNCHSQTDTWCGKNK